MAGRSGAITDARARRSAAKNEAKSEPPIVASRAYLPGRGKDHSVVVAKVVRKVNADAGRCPSPLMGRDLPLRPNLASFIVADVHTP
jgi:hypothetical protein